MGRIEAAIAAMNNGGGKAQDNCEGETSVVEVFRRCLEVDEGERSKGVQEGGVRDSPSCIPESLNAVLEALMNEGTNEQDDLLNGFESPSKKRVDVEGARKDMGCENICTKHVIKERARKDMGCGPNYLRHGERDTKEIGGLFASSGQSKEAAKGMEQDFEEGLKKYKRQRGRSTKQGSLASSQERAQKEM
ncbi:hypothetical protein Ancab_033953, partial [Ancistrocladus abbreviatus]